MWEEESKEGLDASNVLKASTPSREVYMNIFRFLANSDSCPRIGTGEIVHSAHSFKVFERMKLMT